jgi:multidrug resistance efflux pump
MDEPSLTRFRKDLIIEPVIGEDSSVKGYLVKDPISEKNFEFGEEEYFLCQSIDGISTPSQILVAFKNRFGVVMSEESFNQFFGEVSELGLLETFNISLSNSPITSSKKTNSPFRIYLYSLPNPSPKFAALAAFFQPFRGLIKLLVWLMIPGITIALLTFFYNQSAYWQEMESIKTSTPLLARHLFNISIVNFASKLIQAITCASFGGTVETFALIVALIFPRFYVSKKPMWKLKREEQVWTFASSLLVKLFLFTVGVFTWFSFRGTGTHLATLGLLLTHASFIDFLLAICPLWRADGYAFFVAYFRLNRNLLGRAYLLWDLVLNRRSVPQSLSFKKRLALLLYGLFAILFWFYWVIRVALNASVGLTSGYVGVLGTGAVVIVVCVFLLMAFRKRIAVLFLGLKSKISTPKLLYREDLLVSPRESIKVNKKPKSWKKIGIRLIILIALGIALIRPYHYHVVGQVQLLTPKQQQIQSDVAGKIIKIPLEGGENQWIKAGTVIALLETPETENSVQTTQQQVKQKQAELEKQQALLEKLLATPKKEEVNVAKEQVAVDRAEVKMAETQLEAALSRAEFSSREASRFEELYRAGGYSLQQYENAKKQAEADRINARAMRENIVVLRQKLQKTEANLQLASSGPYPQDIQAARKELEAIRAELGRLEQQLNYYKSQVRRTQLVMPFDGYLTSSRLAQKLGSYLNVGDTIAVAVDDRTILAEAQVSEFQVDQLFAKGQAEVRLFAFPHRSFRGQVASIEPVTVTDTGEGKTSVNQKTGKVTQVAPNTSGQVVNVLIAIPNPERILKSGMTGYAKIKGNTLPAVMVYGRTVVRFVRVEVWSWFP